MRLEIQCRAGDRIEILGMSYTGSTPALGAGRPGSIPGIPTVVLSDSSGDCRGSEENVDRVPCLPVGRVGGNSWQPNSAIDRGYFLKIYENIFNKSD